MLFASSTGEAAPETCGVQCCIVKVKEYIMHQAAGRKSWIVFSNCAKIQTFFAL
jgi:hypothetical protein